MSFAFSSTDYRLQSGFEFADSYMYICNMQKKLQPLFEAKPLGRRILEERTRQRLTLHKISELTGVDEGQISRFCRGDFKRASKNLQKICDFLQVEIPKVSSHPAGAESTPDISDVLEEVKRNWEQAGTRQKDFGDAVLAIARMLK